MATIVDWQIRDLARNQGLIEPYEPEQTNPASYDVTLGSTIKIETRSGWQEVDISTPGFVLDPGVFALAHTAEFVRIPNNFEAQFQLKSSRGREGYEHLLAGYIDPGFMGQITLELTNVTRYKQLPLYAGFRIGQLRFMKIDQIPHRPYSLTGRYHNDTGVQLSRG